MQRISSSCVLFFLHFAAVAGLQWSNSLDQTFDISVPLSKNKIGVVLTFWYKHPSLIVGESASRIALFSHNVNVHDDTKFFEDVADFCSRNLVENCIDMGEQLHAWYLGEIKNNPMLSENHEWHNDVEMMKGLDMNFTSYYNITVESLSEDHSVNDAAKYSFLSKMLDNNVDSGLIDELRDEYDEYACPPVSDSNSDSPAAPLSSRAGDFITVVSGFWHLAGGNRLNLTNEGNLYPQWLNNTLRINMPYIIFADDTSIDLIANIRRSFPTLIVERRIEQFKTFDTFDSSWVNGHDVHSRNLSMIWLEKVNLLLKASQMTGTEYYMWIDAALSRPSFRLRPPPQAEWSADILLSLPIEERIAYCYIKDTYHSFPAGVMIVHRKLVPLLHLLFYEAYDACRTENPSWKCGSEQYLLTQIRDEKPELFHPMSYDYGDIMFLWSKADQYHRAN